MARSTTARRPVFEALVTLAVTSLVLAACGDDGPTVGEERAAQIRIAAEAAGLSTEIAEALALAARADDATFQVTYAGTDGAGLVVSQAPPDRRVDVVQGDLVVESRVLRDHVGYRCAADEAASEPGALLCTRAAGALETAGTFSIEALRDFTGQLSASMDTLDVSVDERTIAGVDATCLTSTPKAGTVIDGSGPGTDVLCLSAEGAQLLVDRDGTRLVAAEYTTRVPKGTFDVSPADR